MGVHITTQATVESQTGSLKLPRFLWQNHLKDLAATAIAVSTEAADGPKDAPLRPETYDYWKPTAVTATWRADLGSAKLTQYAAIAGHNVGSAGARVRAQYSTDDSVWNNASDEAIPTDDSPIVLLFPQQTARYWRIQLTTQIARLPVIRFGTVLAMPYPVSGGITPTTLDRVTMMNGDRSNNGQFLGQSYRSHGIEGAVKFSHLDGAWYRANFDPFVKEARKNPFFFAWRISSFPGEVGYVWATKQIKPTNMGKNGRMEVQVAMEGMGLE